MLPAQPLNSGLVIVSCHRVKFSAGAAKTYTGGIMFWATGYDVNGKYSLVNAAVNAEPYVVKPVKK